MSHPLEREPAEMVAARLNRWQILDLVLIHREGRMKICRNGAGQPCGPVQRLIDDNIICEGAAGDYVLPGPRFTAVMYALARAGEINSLRADDGTIGDGA
jgi:hypothetical protein